jgi:hypothetical protein
MGGRDLTAVDPATAPTGCHLFHALGQTSRDFWSS